MTTAGAGRPPKCGVAIQTATPVGEPCAMARTPDPRVFHPGGTPGGNTRVEPAHIDGKSVMPSPPFPACDTR